MRAMLLKQSGAIAEVTKRLDGCEHKRSEEQKRKKERALEWGGAAFACLKVQLVYCTRAWKQNSDIACDPMELIFRKRRDRHNVNKKKQKEIF